MAHNPVPFILSTNDTHTTPGYPTYQHVPSRTIVPNAWYAHDSIINNLIIIIIQ